MNIIFLLLNELKLTLDINSRLSAQVEKLEKENKAHRRESRKQIETLLRGIEARQEQIDYLKQENQRLIKKNEHLASELKIKQDKRQAMADLNVNSVTAIAKKILTLGKDLNLTTEDLNTISYDLDVFVGSVEKAAFDILSEVEEIKAEIAYFDSLFVDTLQNTAFSLLSEVEEIKAEIAYFKE